MAPADRVMCDGHTQSSRRGRSTWACVATVALHGARAGVRGRGVRQLERRGQADDHHRRRRRRDQRRHGHDAARARRWRSTRRASPTSEIRVGGVASVDNPLGGKYGDSFEGVKAYFDMINASGGIYGRELDARRRARRQGVQQQHRGARPCSPRTSSRCSRSPPCCSPARRQLVDEGIPTFGWTINPEWEGSAEDPKANLFGQTGSFLCFDCASPGLPWLMGQAKANKVGVLAYSVPQSAGCADGIKNSFDKYGERVDAEVAFVDKSLQFGAEGPVGPGVEDEGRRGRLRGHLHGHQRRRSRWPRR